MKIEQDLLHRKKPPVGAVDVAPRLQSTAVEVSESRSKTDENNAVLVEKRLALLVRA